MQRLRSTASGARVCPVHCVNQEKASHFTLLYLQLLIPLLASEPTASRTAIQLDHIARHMGSSCATKEQNSTGEILRLSNASTRLTGNQRIQRTLHSKCSHLTREDSRADGVHSNMMRHQLTRLHPREVNTRRFAWPVRESSGSGSCETAFVACGDVYGYDACHGGDVYDAGRVVCCGSFCKEGVQAYGCVEDGFHVEGH